MKKKRKDVRKESTDMYYEERMNEEAVYLYITIEMLRVNIKYVQCAKDIKKQIECSIVVIFDMGIVIKS